MQFLQLLINGTSIGCIYALVALGFVLIYKATEVVNFAQGEFLMLGGFMAYTFIGILGMPYWLGVLLSIVFMMGFGALVDAISLRPVLGQSQFTIIMLTIGLGYVFRSGVAMIPGWGTEAYAFSTPFSATGLPLLTIGDKALIISEQHLSIIVSTVVLVVLLTLFFRFTRQGIAMQATSQNQLAANYMGIPVKWVFSRIWGISAGVAAAAGILLAPITLVEASMGFIGLKAFPAAVLGGFGSIPGAIVGGLIIGNVEAIAGFYLPPGFKDVAAYVILLLVLMIRPQGLFGATIRKKV